MSLENINEGIVELIRKAETELPKDVINSLKSAYKIEEGIAKLQIETILKNVELAKKTKRPMCQDTGIQSFFVEIGHDFPFIKNIKDFIIEGVRSATDKVPLRPNTVNPLTNQNNNDNCGLFAPYISWEICKGDNVKITVLPKGAGSENMSKLAMLKPSVGIKGVKDYIVNEMIAAGGNPCPPTVVGVGIGGVSDLALKISKKSLLRPVGIRNKNRKIAKIEEELIKRINQSGIGPMGLGGKTTVLDVHVELAYRHPASLPVGITVQCWANRRATMIIDSKGNWEIK